MITIHSANHTPEDYENLARFFDAGIEALCIHNCSCCPFQKVCNELNRAIIYCLAKSGK